MEQLVRLTIAVIILALIFGLLERFWPAIAEQRTTVRRRESLLDLCYWFFNPIVTKAVTGFCAAMVIFFLIGLTDGLDLDTLKLHGFGPISRQPEWLIVIEMLILGDFIGYWTHRAFHRLPDLWDIHAIHHSSEELDWLSAVRVHPLNDIIAKTLRVMPFVFLGFPLTAVAAYVPLLTFFAIFLHANVRFSFGPLKYVIASPTFHRWHHTSADEGRDRNFAGLFPFIDLLFGTFYLPSRSPTQFGVSETIAPGFAAQLIYPFKPARRTNA